MAKGLSRAQRRRPSGVPTRRAEGEWSAPVSEPGRCAPIGLRSPPDQPERNLRASSGRSPERESLVGSPGRVRGARPGPSKPYACGILETCSSDLRTRSQIGELLPPLRRKDRMIRSCPQPSPSAGSNLKHFIFTFLKHLRWPDGNDPSSSIQRQQSRPGWLGSQLPNRPPLPRIGIPDDRICRHAFTKM